MKIILKNTSNNNNNNNSNKKKNHTLTLVWEGLEGFLVVCLKHIIFFPLAGGPYPCLTLLTTLLL